jgi:hypothetical protein
VTMRLSDGERRALGQPAGRPVRLSAGEADRLLADPAYRASLGQPGSARHFRRSMPDGTGLHLVLSAEDAELHRDRHDPHAGPAALLLHLSADAPREALSLLAAGLAVLHRLGAGSR